MKKIFYFLLFVANLSYAQNVPYILTATNEPYAHIDEDATLLTDTLGENWDDYIYDEVLEEPFNIFGKEYAKIEMDNFDLGLYESASDDDISTLIFPLAEDMVDKKSHDETADHSLVYMKKSGEAGNRLIELELVEGAFYDDESNDISLTTLYASINESNGVITYHFGPKSGSFDSSIYLFGNPLVGLIQTVNYESDNYFLDGYFLKGENDAAEIAYLESLSETELENGILSQYTLDAYPEEGTKYVLSPMSSATSDNDLLSLNVYPNPTVSQVQIMGMSEQATVRVYALDGSLLKHSKSATLDLSAFQNGVYMIEVVDGTNRYVSKIEKID